MDAQSQSIETIVAQLLNVETSCDKIVDLLTEIRDHGGVRSKAFLSSSTGRALISQTDTIFQCARKSRIVAGNLAGGNNELSEQVMKHVARELNEAANELTKQGTRPAVCILAPLFTPETITDGYIRRVSNIDSLIPDDIARIYVHASEELPYPTFERADENHLYLRCSNSCDNSALFDIVAKFARLIYSHSILAFSGELVKRCEGVPFILDFHGVAPEEADYTEQGAQVVEARTRQEQNAVALADAIICVTDTMVEHIKHKYPTETARTEFTVLPIFDIQNANRTTCKKPTGKPCAVYAGGIARWQMLDETFDAMSAQKDLCSYRVFIPTPERFDALWGDRPRPSDLIVDVRPPETLPLEYQQCHYGFVLREDCIVNNVACPTKLIEYIANDVIPIVLTPHIGDFARDGMAYITLEDFLQGTLPGDGEIALMLEKNRLLLDKQLSRFEEGKKHIVDYFERLA